MIDPEVLEKFYTKVFSVPRKRISAGIGIVTILIASYLNGISSRTFFAERYFFVGLSILALLLLASKFMESAFTSRRLFFLALFFLIFTEIFDFIAIKTGREEIIVVAPASSAFLISTVLYLTSRRPSFLGTFVLLLALYPITYVFSFRAEHRFLAYLISSLAGVLASKLFLKYLDKRFGIVEVLPLFKSFLWFWLTGDSRDIVREFDKYGEDFEGRFVKLRVGDVTIHVANVHPGPLRMLGGSKLVKEIMSRERNVFFHAASMHSENPIDVREIERLIDEDEFVKVTPRRPYRVEGKRFWLKVYPFGDFSFVIVHGREYMDDLPFEIQGLAESVFGDCILIDSHSCHGRELEVRDILEIVELFKKKSSEETHLRYFYDEIYFETEAICSKVSVLLLDYSGDKHAIVVFDSNNVTCKLRNEIVSLFSREGYDVDVLSTDNHEKTGVSPRKGYRAAGDKEREVVIDFLKKAIRSARFSEAECYLSVKTFRTRVMGEQFFKDLEKAFREIGEKAMYSFLALMVLNPLLAYLLAILVM